MIDQKWIASRLSNQNSRARLLGGDNNPLQQKAKAQQSIAREKLSQSAVKNMRVLTSTVQSSVTPVPVHQETMQKPVDFSSYLDRNNQKKKEKKEKKNKKKKQKIMNSLTDNLLDANARNGNLMAEMMKASQNLIMVNGSLWLYNDEDGCFHRSDYNQIAKLTRSSLDYEETLKLSTRDYKESFDQLLISEELVRDEDCFLANRPYVNCLNGVVDVCKRKLLDHSPEWMFRHCVQAQYIPGSECPRFLEYVDYITAGDKELKRLLRVLMGYIWSSYTNARIAVLMYGVSGTGKSVLCRLISRILGDEFVGNTDLSFLQKPEYVANLSGKLLNVAPDLKNEPLRDVGYFKSLVSHNDKVSARVLYSNPITIRGGEIKMLFSTNHLLEFEKSLGEQDITAVFNRLIYFPYQNKPVDRHQDNKHLSDDLYEECDAIFTWAMEGLRDYVNNGEVFPIAKASEDIKMKNMACYCPEKMFEETCLKKIDERYESVTAVKKAYEAFCKEAGVTSARGSQIDDYLEQKKVNKIKTRVGSDGQKCSAGANIWYYEGIRLKNKYRVLKDEEE